MPKQSRINERMAMKHVQTRGARGKRSWLRYRAGRLALLAIGAALATTRMAGATTVPSRSLPSYVLLALDRLKMKDFAFTNLGNIGTNNAGGKLNWGRNS